MSDIPVSAANSYDAPVDRLLALGEPRHDEWVDYLSLGLSRNFIPELIRMATDAALHKSRQDGELIWAPVHAWRALGQLKSQEAIAPLLTLFQLAEECDDWVMIELPEVMAEIGPSAIEPAALYLADTTNGDWARSTAADALGHISKAHPESREICVAKVAAQLEHFATQTETLNALLVSTLWDLKAVETIPVIERAFASGRVDESVIGDFEDVQVHFGVKTQRENPREPNWLTQHSDIVEEGDSLMNELDYLSDDEDSYSPAPYLAPVPYVAPPKIGRNEPCPCGSGKKYKKCCGG